VRAALDTLAGALFVSCCDSREPHAGKTLDCGNVRHLRPACFGIRTDNSDTNFFLGHSSTSFYCKVIDTKLSIPSGRPAQIDPRDESARRLVLINMRESKCRGMVKPVKFAKLRQTFPNMIEYARLGPIMLKTVS
jgi:hypothetical protein